MVGDRKKYWNVKYIKVIIDDVKVVCVIVIGHIVVKKTGDVSNQIGVLHFPE